MTEKKFSIEFNELMATKKKVKKKTKYSFKGGFKKQIGVVSIKGAIVGRLHSCKDQLMRSYSGLIASKSKSISTTSPEFAYWCAEDTAERNAEKFQGMINRLEKRLGLKERTTTIVPETGKTSKSACFIVKTHRYWICHPINLSAFLVILCQTQNMKMREGFKAFTRRMIDDGKNRNATYLRMANNSGVLSALMNGKLPGHKTKRFRMNWRNYKYGHGFATFKSGKIKKTQAIIGKKKPAVKKIDGVNPQFALVEKIVE